MRKMDYKEIILRSLLAGAILPVALMAPNVIKVLAPYLKKLDKIQQRNTNHYFKRKIFDLKGRGLIQFSGGFVKLTDKGQKEIDKYILGDTKIKKPKRWDGKWRIVSYDVKNYRTPVRSALRGHLQRLGFVRYQKSIWIHPYDCEEIIILLKSHLKFGKEVMYIVAEHLENDKWLRNNFELN